MANLTIENIDLSSEVISNPEYIDALLSFAAEATVAKGTILARKVVADAVVAAAVAGNTSGSGTVTAATVVAGSVIPLVGAYTLVCVTAVSNGGIFKLLDPNGAIVATDIKMTVGSTTATVVKTAGLQFTITDATDFVAGDSFTLTVAAVDYYVPFDSAGAGGAQVPSAIITSAVYKGTAGTVPVRVAVRGNLRKDKLIIAADGNSANVNSNVIDGLRRFGFLVESVTNRSVLDNQ